MELQDLRDKLAVINNEEIGITVHLVKKNDDSTESILNADISEDLAEELRIIFREEINNRIIDNDELTLRNISSTHETINSIFLYDLEEFPDKLSIINYPFLLIKCCIIILI